MRQRLLGLIVKARRVRLPDEIMAAGDEMEMPFDGKRMIFGGFTPLLMEGDRT